MAVRIGEMLLKEKRITPEQLQETLSYQRQNGGKLGLNLVKLGHVKDEEIMALLSRQYGVPSIELERFEIDPAVIKLVPAETAQKYQIVPLSRSGPTLTIAITDPTNVFALDDIKFMTGYNVEPVVASESAVMAALEKYYGKGAENNGSGSPSALDAATKALEDMPLVDGGDVEVLQELEEISAEALARQGEEAPVVKLVNVILMSAIQRGSLPPLHCLGARTVGWRPGEGGRDARHELPVVPLLRQEVQPPVAAGSCMARLRLHVRERTLPAHSWRPWKGSWLRHRTGLPRRSM